MPSLRGRIVQSLMRVSLSRMEGNRSIMESRVEIDALAEKWIRPPKKVSMRTILADNIPSEWLEPCNLETQRVILYLHGGGYTICSPATHRMLTSHLALLAQARLLVPAYRLAPEYPFPAALEDALTAYHWLLKQGVLPEHIAIGGDSAGGGLTVSTAVSLRDAGEPLPAALFLISPWTDLTFSGESYHTRRKVDPIFSKEHGGPDFVPAYVGKDNPANPLISPLFADLQDLPPMLIHVGDHEVLLNDSTLLAERAKGAQVNVEIEIWEGMWHVWHVFAPYVPESQRAIEQIGAFIQRHLAE